VLFYFLFTFFFVEMDLESLKRHYCKSQVNGTISITTRIVLNDTLKSSLEEGAGEVGS